MTCGHCVTAVTEEVSAVPGVTAVAVDLASGGLTVTSDSPVDEAAVRAAVEEGGYEVAGRRHEHPPPPGRRRRVAHRRDDLRLLRQPHREEAQQAGRRHGDGQLRHREGEGHL